ncbi:MAG: tRNA dihydrouridine synthase DusB [Pseudomonadota bacterium]
MGSVGIMLQFGDVTLSAPVFLAPMSGATDAPFRRQAEAFGAPAVVTEMIAGEELASGRRDMVRRAAAHGGAGPFIIQLAGRDPRWMREATEIATEAGADVVDINMGCPSKQVTGGLSGSALMQDLDLARDLIAATRAGTDKTVTLKTRLGWDNDTLNAPELAQIAEGEGVSLLTVHGRTRCQFYKGSANWHAIRRSVESVSMPVIANGDIVDVAAAKASLKASGANGVMIGRAAMGRPWLVGEIAAALTGQAWRAPTLAEQIQSMIDQVRDSVSLYGERLGVRTVRKHVSAFVDFFCASLGGETAARIRRRLCQLYEADALIDGLAALGEPDCARIAA